MMPSWSDLVHILRLEELTGLALAILLGGAIGIERELKDRARLYQLMAEEHEDNARRKGPNVS